MSQENVELVRRAFQISQEDVRRGDPGAVFDECVREGIVATDLDVRAAMRGGVGVAGIDDVVGREGWVEFMGGWTEDFDDWAFEVEEIIDADNDRGVSIQRNSGTGKASRAPVEMCNGVVWTLKARRIVRAELFARPDDALRAAGLEE